MAVLSDADRAAVHAAYMQDRSAVRDTLTLLKADLRAAVNAVDDWIVANAASFNSALPQPARAALTASQKALLLQYVVQKRYSTGA